MRNKIQDLISRGQTKEAIEFLLKWTPDALLLQAEYNNNEKQFNIGLIDFHQWGRIRGNINFKLLELVDEVFLLYSIHKMTDDSCFVQYRTEDNQFFSPIDISVDEYNQLKKQFKSKHKSKLPTKGLEGVYCTEMFIK